MTAVEELTRKVQEQPTPQTPGDPSALLESLSDEAQSEFVEVMEATAALLNRVIGDAETADRIRGEIEADPAAALGDHGIPADYHVAVLDILGAPASLKEKVGDDREFVPLVPVMLGSLRAAQVAVKVAPRVHNVVRNTAPWIAVGGAVGKLFD